MFNLTVEQIPDIYWNAIGILLCLFVTWLIFRGEILILSKSNFLCAYRLNGPFWIYFTKRCITYACSQKLCYVEKNNLNSANPWPCAP